LLQYTRYVTWKTEDVEVSSNVRVPRPMRSKIREIEVDIPVLERRKSEKTVKIKKRFFNPNGSDIHSEYTFSYSGMLPITQTHKEFFPFLVLPVIELVNNSLPGQQQVQTATMEPFSLATGTDQLVFNSRSMELFSGLPNYVTGIAGRKTELSSYMGALSDNNAGGFLGDLFSTVGNIANTIGL